jgi:hypothetical protein
MRHLKGAKSGFYHGEYDLPLHRTRLGGTAVSESILDRLRDIVLFMAGVIAVVSLILALYEGFNQRVPTAIFLAGLRRHP